MKFNEEMYKISMKYSNPKNCENNEKRFLELEKQFLECIISRFNALGKVYPNGVFRMCITSDQEHSENEYDVVDMIVKMGKIKYFYDEYCIQILSPIEMDNYGYKFTEYDITWNYEEYYEKLSFDYEKTF